LEQLLDLALSAAREAGEIALRHFRDGVAVETKADRSPVTVADREAEACIRCRIEARFPREEAFHRIRGTTGFERTWGDCYGHALVATGRAEIMLDPIFHEWDAAPLLPILEAAGGVFTDWRGTRTTRGGSGVSTNAALAGEVRRLLVS
jgi:fructose-1,6-bisphosphatase/inositol monophosphatase family enzyme